MTPAEWLRPAPELDREAPRRKHSERHPGESYPDALTRVAGERDAARLDVKRLEAELTQFRAASEETP